MNWIKTSQCPPEDRDFPIWAYFAKAAHASDYDCRGPVGMRTNWNNSFTHWQPWVGADEVAPPAPLPDPLPLNYEI